MSWSVCKVKPTKT